MTARLIVLASLFATTSGPAFAVFVDPVPPLPEPTTAALFAAGALAVGGVRYLTKRKDK
jgi:hypothetical protein